jgi:hypothetical protein
MDWKSIQQRRSTKKIPNERQRNNEETKKKWGSKTKNATQKQKNEDGPATFQAPEGDTLI